MGTHHRAERGELEPTGIEFIVFLITRPTQVAIKESTDVGIPVRVTGRGEVQGRRYLILESGPTGGDVRAPCVRTVSLLSGVGRTREDDATLVGQRRFGTMVVVHATHMYQRIGIAHATPCAAHSGHEVERLFHVIAPLIMVWFGRVQPIAVYTF